MAKNKFDTLIIASHNEGKIEEFKSLFSTYNFKIKSSLDLKIPEVQETGKTFEENALLKLKSIPKEYFAIADDSGLCIKALGGKPGIFSSRFASEHDGWSSAMEKLFKETSRKKNRDFSAKFICTLAVNIPNEKVFIYFGEVHGRIVWPPSGKNGFGYDPFFVPKGYKRTFGDFKHSDKILVDHRFQAFKKFAKEHLNNI